jgi:hypothetical protein
VLGREVGQNRRQGRRVETVCIDTRGCLSQICSTFDPHGIIAPVMLVGKRILQTATRLKIGWYEPLPDHLMSAWLMWRRELQSLDGIGLPRCYFPGQADAKLTLHHFSDACEEGYGAVSYIRVEYPHGEVRVAILTSKSRTTPSDFTTVARLELHACVVAARRLVLEERVGPEHSQRYLLHGLYYRLPVLDLDYEAIPQVCGKQNCRILRPGRPGECSRDSWKTESSGRSLERTYA